MPNRIFLRIAPHDTSTPDGREAERVLRARWSILTNIVSKCLAMLVSVVGVSLTVPYLGAERFGVWMTIASLAGVLTFLDLGVGNALTNRIARQAAQDDHHALRNAISGGLGISLLIGAIASASLWLFATTLPWERLIKLDDSSLVRELRKSAQLFGVFFGLHLFTYGIHRVFAGLQRAFVGHCVSTLGSIIALGGLFIAARYQAGIPTLLTITFGVQSTIGLFLLRELALQNKFAFFDIKKALRTEAPVVLKTGYLFFILQIGTIVGWGADSLILASVEGVAQVATFSLAQKLFQFVSQPLTIINAPLWAAYADAKARSDIIFIRKTFAKSIFITIGASTIGAIAMVISGEWLINHWTQGAITMPLEFLMIYAIWTIIETTGNAFAMFLNGCHIIKQQVIFVTTFTALVIPLKITGVLYLGMPGLVISSIFSYITAAAIIYGKIYYIEISSLLDITHKNEGNVIP